MKTILWKEFRENAKWTILIMACLVIAQGFALASGRSELGSYMANVTILGSMFLMVTSFGAALTGIAIGLLQILPEQARDQWAFLLHKPAGRTQIFLGKAVAGSLLVLLATGIPFLISVIYVQVPGQFASPFVPGMLFPGISDLFLGQAFYFGALALGLQRGRWFGARGLLGISLFPVFISHVNFPWPVLSSLIAAGVYAISAWGSMVGGSEPRTLPQVARFARTGVILVGSSTFFGVIAFLISLLPSERSGIGIRNFAVSENGSIFIVSWDTSTSAFTIFDLEGNQVTDPQFLSGQGEGFLQASYVTWTFDERWISHQHAAFRNPRNPMNYLQRTAFDYESPELWFYLVDQRLFVGYDILSGMPVGTIGRDGFAAPGEKAEPFQQPLRESTYAFGSPHLYGDSQQIYRVNFSERDIRPLFLSEMPSIFGFSPLRTGMEVAGVAVALKDALYVLGPEGNINALLPYRHDPLIWGELSVIINPELARLYVISNPSQHLRFSQSHENAVRSSYLDVFSVEGEWLAGHELTHPPLPVLSPGPLQLLGEAAKPPAAFAIDAANSRAEFFDNPGVQGDLSRGEINPEFVRSLLLSLTASLLLALGTWGWARRAGFANPQAIQWSTFVFCFGLPGLLTFRTASSWPIQVPCATCTKKRPIDIPHCPNCTAEWPSPSRIGQEIFG